MKNLTLFRIALCLVMFLGAFSLAAVAGPTGSNGGKEDKLWRPIEQSNVPERGRRMLTPERSLTFSLDRSVLDRLLRDMPAEFTDAARGREVIMEIPMPDGTISRFRIEDSPVLASHLADAFPTWRTFQGYGIDDPTATARFDWTKNGFHGYVLSSQGTIYIDPIQENDTSNYLVYYKHEYGAPNAGDFYCRVDDLVSELAPIASSEAPDAVQFSYGTAIRTYRIAVATTGEWARGTTSSTDPQTVRTAALAALTTTINRLDGIFRREIAASFQMVNPSITNDATNIIFDDPATDPYNNTDSEAQLTLNQTTIDARVGAANYDIGHLYGTGGGGIAGQGVCAAQKAEGYSARAGFYGDPFTVDYVAHEIGHQYGASHTYNNMDNGGACNTRSVNNAFEVGSGSTLMSYVGICNIRNLQQYVDTGRPSFHTRSLTQMTAYLQTPEGTCGTPAGTNAIPTVNAGSNYTIPRLTPFTLTASGNDANPGDVPNLLYSWEQYDLSPSGTGQLGTPPLSYDVDTDGVLRSLFRAYSPVTSPSRTFPSLAFILNPANNNPAGSNNPALTYQGTHPTGAPGAVCQAGNDCVIGESLPSQARTMNFRVTVRDGQGGIADAGMTVTTAANTGPFQVTSQNAASTWTVGSTQTVTWDVAGSDTAPINAANVKISLSTNGGQSFPITLLASTPNNGTAQITVPDNAATQGRIKVEAVGNIFFDINNADIAITGGAPAISVGNATGGERPALGGGSNQPESDPIVFTVSLSSPSTQTVTIHLNTNGITATEGGDFQSIDGLEVVFPPGTVTRTVSIPLIEDPGDEPDETFSLDVADAANATVADGQGIGTIVDDDAAPIETMQFSSSAYVDDESQSAVVTISRLGDLMNATSVTFSTFSGGTATGGAACGAAGVDYESNAGTVIDFAAGETSETVSIPLCKDDLYEADETILVRLTNPVGGALGTPNVATVTINDTANHYRNTQPINTFQGSAAAPYPSSIAVTGAPLNVHRVRVTLYDVSHSFPDNLDVLLVNPQGRTMVIMGDSGGANAISPNSPVTLTFTDIAGQVLPDSNALTRGKFEPTTWEAVVGDFPSPAPVGPYATPGSTVGGSLAQTFFGNFGQLDGNGTWSLYIRDDNGVPIAPEVTNGLIQGGWGLELLPATAAGVEVSGRVTTPDGRGLRNAVVSMVDSQGMTRTATTSSFGYYSFGDIEVGQSFVVSVTSRRYRFAPRVIQVFDTLADVDFTGQE